MRPFWRRALRWLLWTAAVGAVAVLVAALALETDWVRERARLEVERIAGEALGREVSIESMDVSLLARSASAESVVVGGQEGLAEPLARVEALSVQVGPGLVRALLSDEPVVLAEVVVTAPRIDLVFDENGRSNLPDFDRGGGGGNAAVQIDVLHVERGLLRVEEQAMPLDLTASEVEAVLRQLGADVFVAEARSRDLELRLPEATEPGTPPLEGSLEARIRIAQGVVAVERAELVGRNLTLAATGTLGADGIDLAIEGSLDSGLVEQMGWAEEVSGRLDAALSFVAGEERWRLAGEFGSDRLGFQELTVEGVRGRLTIEAEGLEILVDSGELAGAALSGSATMPFGLDDPTMTISVEAAGIHVEELLAAMEPPPLVGLAGRATAAFEYTFPVADPEGGVGSGAVRIRPPAKPRVGDLQLTGSADVSIRGGRLRFDRVRLSAPEQELEASLTMDLASLEGEVDLLARTGNPAALIDLVPEMRFREEAEIWEPLLGVGEVSGRLTVSPEAFAGDLTLAFEQLSFAALPPVSAAGTVRLDNGGLQRFDAVLRRGEGTVDVAGSLPFEEAVPGVPMPGVTVPDFDLRIDLDKWPLGDVAALLDVELPVQGLVGGSLHVGGSPAFPEGEADLLVANMTAGDLVIPGEMTGRLAFDPEIVGIRPARYVSGESELEVVGTLVVASGALDLEVHSSPFDLAGPLISQVVVGDLRGFAEVSGSIGGTLENPTAHFSLNGMSLEVGGRPLGDEGRSEIGLTLADGTIDVDGSFLGLVELSGAGRWDERGLALDLDAESTNLAELTSLAMEEPLEGLGGAFSGALVIAWGEERESVLLELDRLELQYRDSRLTNVEPVLLSWGPGGLSLELLYLEEEGTGSDLILAGDIDAVTGELDMAVQSSIDVGWLGLYFPDLDIRGRLEVLAAIRGKATALAIDGQARMVDGRMIIEGFPHALESIEGLFFIYPEQVIIDSSRASFARGVVTADGRVIIAGDDLGSYELRLRGDELDIRYPEDWRIRAGGQLTLASTAEGQMLSGAVEVERASYVKDFELGFANLLRVMFQRTPDLVDETEEVLRDTRLNIAVQGEDALRIQTNIAQVTGDLDFTLRGTLAQPVILGDIRLDRGGSIEFAGAEYTLERGNLTFSNPFRNDPAVDLVASTSVREFDVRLNVFGPVAALETSFSSTPPLPTLDIVSLLTTRSTDTLGSLGRGPSLETEQAAGMAETFLASQAASLAGQRVGSLFGLDQVQITPLTGGSSELSTARVTVGKRISRDVYVTYSYDSSQSDEEIVEVAWQMSPSIVVMLRATDKASYTLDVRWTKTF